VNRPQDRPQHRPQDHSPDRSQDQRRRVTSRGLGVVAALTLVVALPGCSAGERVAAAPAAAPAHPAVTPLQAVQILGTVDAAIVRGVQGRDPEQLGNRAQGPAHEAIAAAITVQAALKQPPSVPPSPNRPRLMLTLAGPWPRWFAAAGSSPSSSTPLLRVLTSPGARTPYGLWGQLSLLPGAALPEVASATMGAPVLGAAATGLAATPADTVARYAELLNRGDASPYAAQFATDTYRTELTSQLGTDRAAFQKVGVGEVLAQHTASKDAPLAMRTKDGGALVIGRIDQRYTATVSPGRGSVRLDPQLAVLVGKPSIAVSLERRSVQVLAFYVPPVGTTGPITLLAASKSDVSATGR
jgi:hypothetical protein